MAFYAWVFCMCVVHSSTVCVHFCAFYIFVGSPHFTPTLWRIMPPPMLHFIWPSLSGRAVFSTVYVAGILA